MEVSGRASVVVQASVVLLVGLASGCGGPVGVKAPPGASSSEDGGGTTSGTASGAATSIGGESEPGRVPPEPFELPEGCGDGVIAPGQYDCFFPVPLAGIETEIGTSLRNLHPLDLDGDGRDEIIALTSNWKVTGLRWDDGELRWGPLVEQGTAGTTPLVQTRWDWNGDGHRDLTLLPQHGSNHCGVLAHANLGLDWLGEAQWQFETPPMVGCTGHAVPIDVDGDGTPEVLVALRVGGFGDANPVEDLTLFRRIRSSWEPVGEAHRFPACGWLHAAAYGDFDEDGDEDIAVIDHGQACDPFPPSYDPEWYQVGVLLSDSERGVLDLGGWYPIGSAASDPALWAEDVTGDGHLDLVVRVSWIDSCEVAPYCIYPSVSVMRGRGDGSFEEGQLVDLSPTMDFYEVQALIDVDGDGVREWIVPHGKRPWVIPFDFSKDAIAPMVALNDPEAGGSTRFHESVGDINGDGVDDYTVGSHLEDSWSPYMGRFLMVSAP